MVTAVIMGEETEAQREARDRQERAAATAAMSAQSGGFDLMGERPPAPDISAGPQVLAAAPRKQESGEVIPVDPNTLAADDRIKRMPVTALKTDQEKFQFRDVDPGGSYNVAQAKKLAADWQERKVDPLVVAEMPVGSGEFVVIAGHHRLAAAKMAMAEGTKTDPNLPVQILGLDVGNPDTEEGRKSLIKEAVTSNFRVGSQNIAEKIKAFRWLRAQDENDGLTDQAIFRKELPSIHAREQRQLLEIEKLPDTVIAEVSQLSAGGQDKLTPYAEILGDFGGKYGFSDEMMRGLWQDMRRNFLDYNEADGKGKAKLRTETKWKQILAGVNRMDKTTQDTLFEQSAENIAAAIEEAGNIEARDSRLKSEIRALRKRIEECADKPNIQGVNTGELRKLLENQLLYDLSLQDYYKQEEELLRMGREADKLPPPPAKPEFLREVAGREGQPPSNAEVAAAAAAEESAAADSGALAALQAELDKIRAEYDRDITLERQRADNLAKALESAARPERVPEPDVGWLEPQEVDTVEPAEPTVAVPTKEEDLQARVKKEMARLEPGAYLPPSVADDIAEDLGCSIAEVEEAELFLRGDDEPEPVAVAPRRRKPAAVMDLPELNPSRPQQGMLGGGSRMVVSSGGGGGRRGGGGIKVGATKVSAAVAKARAAIETRKQATSGRKWGPGQARR